ncbi:unnamed protein product [Calypogeia fissa]
MHRPKQLANKVVQQWEQNLLLKVMQRKIKCAKSTISGIQGTKRSQSQAPSSQKSNACLEICKEEWNFLNEEQKHIFNESLKAQFDQSSKPKVDQENGIHSDSKYGVATTYGHQNDENISPQLGASHDGYEYELGFPINMENFNSLTEKFHENYRESDDNLLSQIWSSCKIDNSLFDVTTGLNQTRKAGVLHTTDFDSSPIPISKMASLKEKRGPQIHNSHPKKNAVKEPAAVSKFMKKRETGWRE